MNPHALARLRAIAIHARQGLRRPAKIVSRVLGLKNKKGLTPVDRSAIAALRKSNRDPFNDSMKAVLEGNRIPYERVKRASSLKLLTTGSPSKSAKIMSDRGFLNSKAGDVYRKAHDQRTIRRVVGATGGVTAYGYALSKVSNKSKKKQVKRVMPSSGFYDKKKLQDAYHGDGLYNKKKLKQAYVKVIR